MELIAGLLLGAKGMFLYWLYLQNAANKQRITTLEKNLESLAIRHPKPPASQPAQEENY